MFLVVSGFRAQMRFKAISVKENTTLLAFLFASALRQQLHSRLCACCRALKSNKNSVQSGIFFSGNRLNDIFGVMLKVVHLPRMSCSQGNSNELEQPRSPDGDHLS